MQLAEFMLLMNTRGWAMFPSVLTSQQADELTRDLEAAYEQGRQIQVHNGLAADNSGTSHHLLGRGKNLDQFVFKLPLADHIQAWFDGKYILNSFGGFINTPNEQGYITRVHRDVRPYSGDYKLMVNMIVMLDEFTEENGATYLLSGAHRLPEKPNDELFHKYADRLLGPRGSIALWESQLWHSAGHNRSNGIRRALTLTFTRPFMKQQFEYTRVFSSQHAASLDDATRQLLGYNALVPANLDEWYQPREKRFYKPDQD